MPCIFFMNLSVEGYLGCFPALDSANSSPVTMGMEHALKNDFLLFLCHFGQNGC